VALLVAVSLAVPSSASAFSLTITPPSNPSAGLPISLQVAGTADSEAALDVYAIPAGQTCDATYSAASLDYELDPQANTFVFSAGPFNTTTDDLTIPTPGTYVLCGYLGAYASDAATTVSSVTVVAVACNDPAGLAVAVPSQVLAGRRGAIAVSSTMGDTVTDVSYAVAAANSSNPIHFPTSGPAAVKFHGSFRTAPGDGPIVVTIHWMQSAEDGSSCSRTATSNPITVVSTGQRPSVRLDTSLLELGADLTVDFTGDCEVIAPTPATVVLTGAGQVLRDRISDVCGSWPSDGEQRLPTLAVYPEPASLTTPASLDIGTTGSQTSTHAYTLTARVGGRTFTSGLVASVVSHPTTLVYQGTDAFVNYCIDDYKKVRSLGGRLYCVRPGSTIQRLAVTG
jgi:hypothetical protein